MVCGGCPPSARDSVVTAPCSKLRARETHYSTGTARCADAGRPGRPLVAARPQRLNFVMRHHTFLAGALHKAVKGRPAERITELGAGDGHFLLRVAQRLAPRWTNAKVTLLDQQRTVTDGTRAGFAALGWPTEEIVADALRWAEDAHSVADVVVANLFLHHLHETELARLFAAIARRARLFVAVEPRRGAWPLFLQPAIMDARLQRHHPLRRPAECAGGICRTRTFGALATRPRLGADRIERWPL